VKHTTGLNSLDQNIFLWVFSSSFECCIFKIDCHPSSLLSLSRAHTTFPVLYVGEILGLDTEWYLDGTSWPSCRSIRSPVALHSRPRARPHPWCAPAKAHAFDTERPTKPLGLHLEKDQAILPAMVVLGASSEKYILGVSFTIVCQPWIWKKRSKRGHSIDEFGVPPMRGREGWAASVVLQLWDVLQPPPAAHTPLWLGDRPARKKHCNDLEPLTCMFADAFVPLSILGYGY
jgi:hypothetical protein